MLKKEDYIKVVRRPYPPLLLSTLWVGQCKSEHHKKLFEEDASICNCIDIDSDIFCLKTEVKRAGSNIVKYWIKPGVLDSIKKELQKREDELVSAINSDFQTFFQKYEHYAPALQVAYCGEFSEEEVRVRLENKLPKEKVDWFMDKLNIPLEDNLHKKFEYDLVTTDNIKKHVKDYEWIHSRYGEVIPYTEEEALEKLKKINKDEFLQKRKKEKDELKNVINEAKEILGLEGGRAVDLMQFVVFYRTHRTDILNKAVYLYYEKLKSFAEENILSYEELLYCTKEEAFSKKFPPKELIKKRQESHVLLMEKGEVSCLIGSDADSIRKIFDHDLSQSEDLQGKVASKGLARGNTKIINGREDFHKIKTGDILVTSMTTPNMISIMGIASAFITDEGGITCHAAIISRELNKPCIIGTKIATKVLKDGDLVEVDAERGIVTVLKKTDEG